MAVRGSPAKGVGWGDWREGSRASFSAKKYDRAYGRSYFLLLQQRDSKPRPEGKNRAGDAILAAGKSCQAGLSGAERKQADADDRFRIPPLLTALPQCRRTNPSFSAKITHIFFVGAYHLA
mgnify:CR=1 FL=1